MRRRLVVTGLVSAASLGIGFAAETESPAGPPPGVSLTGQWRLDPARSDDPKRKVDDAVEGNGTHETGPQGPVDPIGPPRNPGAGTTPRDHGGGDAPSGPGIDVMTPGVTGGGGPNDPFGSRSSGTGRSVPRKAFALVLGLPETLTIAQRPDLILIQEDDDESRVRGLHPDGSRRPGPDGPTQTRWEKGGLLHVKTWRDDGVDVDETFEVAPDRSLLTVTVRVVQGGTTLDLERVFVPEESEGR